jgi:hypothetical protein
VSKINVSFTFKKNGMEPIKKMGANANIHAITYKVAKIPLNIAPISWETVLMMFNIPKN